MEHAPSTYTSEFDALGGHLNEMAALVHALMQISIENLDERSEQHIEDVAEKLTSLRELDNLTEQRVTGFLMHRTPMGEDLRRVTTTMRMTSELGRMGELAAHIGRRSVGLEGYKAKKSVKRLKRMAEIVFSMFSQAETILADYDEATYEAIFVQDKEVNERYKDLSSDIQEIMADKPGKIEQCTHLLFIAKHLENLGDRTKDLAQAARFISTGQSPTIAPIKPLPVSITPPEVDAEETSAENVDNADTPDS